MAYKHKDELKGNGLWADFIKIRKDLTETGMLAVDAGTQAYNLVNEPGFQPGSKGIDPITKEKLSDVKKKKAVGKASSDDFVGSVVQPPLEACIWAGENFLLDDITAEHAPSKLAWAYMSSMKKNEKIVEQFFATVLPKTFPSSKEIEADAQRRDDGSAITDLIDRVGEAARKSQEPVLPHGPEGVPGESGVPEENVDAGERE